MLGKAWVAEISNKNLIVTGHEGGKMGCLQSAVLERIQIRTRRSLDAGGDGFVETRFVAFDLGLNPRKVKEALDACVAAGDVQRRTRSIGRPHKYRAVEKPEKKRA